MMNEEVVAKQKKMYLTVSDLNLKKIAVISESFCLPALPIL